MSESMIENAARASRAARESRALVTAVLPAVVFGMGQSASARDLVGMADELESAPAYPAIQKYVHESLDYLRMGADMSEADLALLMSSTQTAVFVVRFARAVGADPMLVWSDYLTGVTRVECELN